MSQTYLEAWGDDSETSFGFTNEGGVSSGVYQFKDVTSLDQLTQSITDILGYTKAAGSGTQKLDRKCPATHPAEPWLYANSINALLGKGSGNAQKVGAAANPVPGNPPPLCTEFALYKDYLAKVGFATRPYNVLDNDQIPVIEGEWYPDYSDTAFEFNYAAEWIRYTDWTITPQNNTIQGQTGAMRFPTLPGTPTFTSPPWMYLPDGILTFTWYQVPYRYVTSQKSYIANRNWRGRINQNDWYNWKAGSLLYLNYAVKKYNQPNGEVETQTDWDFNYWTQFAKLCDIEFTFLYTDRTPGSTPPTPFYNNWVAAGHNLLPYLPTRTFEYATSFNLNAPSDQSEWVPPWASFPFEILFSDPDAPGGIDP